MCNWKDQKSSPHQKLARHQANWTSSELQAQSSRHQADPTRSNNWLATPSPQSQSFFQRYGSNLPTSLTYTVPKPETIHLGHPMRIRVRFKLMACAKLNFHGASQHTGTQQMLLCSSKPHALSPDDPIPRTLMLVKKKRKLSTGIAIPQFNLA